MPDSAQNARAPWTFFTNHSHVLLCLAADPEMRMRDVAQRVGITERAVQRIIEDLEAAGYLIIEKEGRRNRYRIVPDLHLRHPVEAHVPISSLLEMICSTPATPPTPKRPAKSARSTRSRS